MAECSLGETLISLSSDEEDDRPSLPPRCSQTCQRSHRETNSASRQAGLTELVSEIHIAASLHDDADGFYSTIPEPQHARRQRSSKKLVSRFVNGFFRSSSNSGKVGRSRSDERTPVDQACQADDAPPVPPRPGSDRLSSQSDFLTSLKELKDHGWYWGPLSWEEAEKQLSAQRDGSFLVRDSANERHILTLSFVFDAKVRHVRIEHYNGKFSFGDLTPTLGCETVVEFVERAMQMSNNGKHLFFLRGHSPGSPPLQVQLLYPVSRFARQRSLKHMCRFVILRRTRADHVACLPLPPPLIRYLEETQYYAEELPWSSSDLSAT